MLRMPHCALPLGTVRIERCVDLPVRGLIEQYLSHAWEAISSTPARYRKQYDLFRLGTRLGQGNIYYVLLWYNIMGWQELM